MPPGDMRRAELPAPLPSGHGGGERDTQEDFDRLFLAVNNLHTSGWYHGAMTYTEAKRKLRHSSPGTFLVRDSSDPNYLFTLSVRTSRGTTSVRIEYENGKFTLDSEEALRRSAPSFDCVVKLLYHYVVAARTQKRTIMKDTNGNGQSNSNNGQLVWLEPSGRRDTEAKIKQPLRSTVGSLQHLTRCALNKYVEPTGLEKLPLPGKLKSYLREYPYDQ